LGSEGARFFISAGFRNRRQVRRLGSRRAPRRGGPASLPPAGCRPRPRTRSACPVRSPAPYLWCSRALPAVYGTRELGAEDADVAGGQIAIPAPLPQAIRRRRQQFLVAPD